MGQDQDMANIKYLAADEADTRSMDEILDEGRKAAFIEAADAYFSALSKR